MRITSQAQFIEILEKIKTEPGYRRLLDAIAAQRGLTNVDELIVEAERLVEDGELQARIDADKRQCH